jgi:putative ABC transport system permease protein
MNTFTRGVRNAFRNGVRTFSIVIILGLSVGLALAMLVARQAVQTKIDSVKGSIGNIVTISPAGARGFEGGGEPLTEAQLAKIKTLAHVVSVTGTLQDRLDSTTTTLQSAIDAGTLGRRFNRSSDGSGGSGGGSQSQGQGAPTDSSGATRSFTMPVTVSGVSDPAKASLQGGGTLKITGGTAFAAGSSDNVAILGAELATKNSLKVGSTFTAYNTTITVAAIYDAGNKFSNAGLIMPLATVQKLSGQAGDVTAATVQIDSISNLTAATKAIQDQLGSAADVTNQQDTSAEALAPLENIKQISLFSLIGAVAAGAAIILLTMVMIVRERRREIGILKAVGASNLRVMLQFMVESATLALLGALAGLAAGVAVAGPVTNMLATAASNSSATSGPGAGGGMGRGLDRMMAQGGASLHNIQATIGWDIILYGLLAAIIIAVVGSAVPAWLSAKVRPAEVMRAE